MTNFSSQGAVCDYFLNWNSWGVDLYGRWKGRWFGQQFICQGNVFLSMHFQPSFMNFHKINRKSSVDHLLNQIREGEAGNIIGFLKPAFIVCDAILISLYKLFGTSPGKSRQSKKLMSRCFQVNFAAMPRTGWKRLSAPILKRDSSGWVSPNICRLSAICCYTPMKKNRDWPPGTCISDFPGIWRKRTG